MLDLRLAACRHLRTSPKEGLLPGRKLEALLFLCSAPGLAVRGRQVCFHGDLACKLIPRSTSALDACSVAADRRSPPRLSCSCFVLRPLHLAPAGSSTVPLLICSRLTSDSGPPGRDRPVNTVTQSKEGPAADRGMT